MVVQVKLPCCKQVRLIEGAPRTHLYCAECEQAWIVLTRRQDSERISVTFIADHRVEQKQLLVD